MLHLILITATVIAIIALSGWRLRIACCLIFFFLVGIELTAKVIDREGKTRGDLVALPLNAQNWELARLVCAVVLAQLDHH